MVHGGEAGDSVSRAFKADFSLLCTRRCFQDSVASRADKPCREGRRQSRGPKQGRGQLWEELALHEERTEEHSGLRGQGRSGA